jgi:SAM-dependent methyltransferase
MTLYQCPQSGEPLMRDGAGLRCADARYSYPIEDGIPVFLKHPPDDSRASSVDRVSSGELSETEDRDKLAQLLALSTRVSCVDAIEQTYGAGSNLHQYATRTPRFLDIVPLRQTDVVLEIGTGLGQFTPKIAERVAELHALEVVPAQARFTQRRCAEAGLKNVQIACGGDDCRLPYPDALFDVVIVNLVFEWCASRNSEESHEAGQARMLRELARVLKPGGVLYLCTKNRYALHYLLGRRDEHTFGWPFGNALPRWLLNAILRLTGKRRQPGYLYSPGALRRLVKENGFDTVEMFCPAPEPRYPDRYVPAEASEIAEARRGRLPFADGRFTRPLMNLMPAALVPYFTYGQAVLARKA